MEYKLKLWTMLSILLAVLMLITAFTGVFFPAVYGDFMRPQRVAESQGQDVVTLTVAIPLLCAGLYLTQRQNQYGPVLWLGALAYALYIYLLYAYGGVYNWAFPLYIAIVGLCIFTIIGVFRIANNVNSAVSSLPTLHRRVIAGYLMGTAGVLALIWGIAISAAINNKTTDEATIIYVTDLAFVLPLFVIAAIQLLRNKAQGYALSGVMLVKAVTLGLSIVAGQVFASAQDVGGEMFLAIFFGVFTALGVFSAVLYFKNQNDQVKEINNA